MCRDGGGLENTVHITAALSAEECIHNGEREGFTAQGLCQIACKARFAGTVGADYNGVTCRRVKDGGGSRVSSWWQCYFHGSAKFPPKYNTYSGKKHRLFQKKPQILRFGAKEG